MTQPAAAPVLAMFGGAFDPPHLGHALVPPYLLARGLADRVVVVPCADHPLGKSMRPYERRLALVRAAMAPWGDAVQVSEIEAELAQRQSGPSYTVHTLQALAERHPGHRIRLVIGTDILGQVDRWHRWAEIQTRFEPIVVPRAAYAEDTVCALPQVSSSEVRGWIDDDSPAARERLSASVPAGVLALLDDWQQAEPREVWVVGRGHVGQHVRGWLSERGWRVHSVGARALCESPEARPAGTPAAVWVVAQDPAVPRVARALVDAGLDRAVPVLHAAGAQRAHTLLAPLVERGNPVATLHPICSLRSERPEARELWQAAFGIEGDDAARAIALSWVGDQPWLDLQGHDADQRRAYHAACSLAANHLAVPLAAARTVLVGQGHDMGTVTRGLRTLLQSSLANLLSLGIPAGVTGPVSRGDNAAVEAHLAALDPDTATLYRTLSEWLVSIVRAPGHDAAER